MAVVPGSKANIFFPFYRATVSSEVPKAPKQKGKDKEDPKVDAQVALAAP